jgi:hypothetical protein
MTARTSPEAIHQDDGLEIEGIGTKEWAGKTAPFFACRKVKCPESKKPAQGGFNGQPSADA